MEGREATSTGTTAETAKAPVEEVRTENASEVATATATATPPPPQQQYAPPPAAPSMVVAIGPSVVGPLVVGTSPATGSGGPVRKKRGRPRKYGPDGAKSGGLAAAASPPRSVTSPSSTAAVTGTQSQGLVGIVKPMSVAGSADGEVKKARGRPGGSGKKMQMDALGSGGIGLTPHVITVKAGEEVSSKIMSFAQHGPRAV